jgi:PhnB protein
MNTQVKPIPDGFHTANVYLQVEDARKQIAFLKQAFGAEERHSSVGPDGNIIHAEVKLGDSVVMIGQAGGPWKPRPCTVYLYVENVDAAHRSAVEAGAKSLGEPKDQFYGDRSGGVEDPNGNWWWIATHIEDVSHEESNRRFAAMGNKHQ